MEKRAVQGRLVPYRPSLSYACRTVRPMLFVIIGRDARDAREKRPAHRPAHLAHLEPLASTGRVVLAGPLTDGAGSLIVVEAESLAEVWSLVGRDPYVANGIFESVEVHPFVQVFPKPT